MTNEFQLVVHKSSEHDTKPTCTFCEDEIGVRPFCLEVRGSYYGPVCNLCAVKKAPDFAKIMFFAETVISYRNRGVPAHITEAMKQRDNDPEWLKRQLQLALNALVYYRHRSLLAELLAENITSVVESGNITKMQNARKLYDENEDEYPPVDDVPY